MTLQALLARNGWLPTDTLTLNRIHEGNWQTIVITADKAQAVVDRHLQGQDAWYSVCPLRSDFQPIVVDDNGKRRRTRGTARDVVGLLALWTDIDVKAGGMAEMDRALDLINRLSDIAGSRPAAVVHSGHGLHPYWRLAEPMRWEPGDIMAVDEAKAIVTEWGRRVQAIADSLGGSVDSVHDLARVLRVPGTQNRKDD